MTSVLKPLPIPVRWLIRPMFFLSLALHGLLLFFPVPSAQESESEAEGAIAISLDAIPAPEPSEIPLPTPSDGSMPSMEPSPAPAPSPIATTPPPRSVPPIAPPTAVPTEPSASSPAAVAPPTVESSSEPSIPPSSPANISPEPPSPSPVENSVFAFAGFPHLKDAQAGCFGLNNCRQVDAGSFRQVGSDLIAQLTAEGYTVSQRDDLTDTGINVYEVSRAQTTQYLSVLSSELGSAVYVLASEPVTLGQLQTSEPLAAGFRELIAQTAGREPVTVEQFRYPELFFDSSQPRAEIATPIYVNAQTSPEQVKSVLEPQLNAAGFSMDAIGSYGGASLYRVQQGAFVAHLSILPTQDMAGSIFVVWNELPEVAE
jgi:hypothetical protein